MSSRNFAIEFQVFEDGTIEPVTWSAEQFSDDSIIMILEEYNQLIWLYYGKNNGIVKRRKALRQAESLRGHGYTVGNTIIGRNIRGIVEIDARKVVRMPAEKEKYDRLLKLFELSHDPFVGECVALSEPGTEAFVETVAKPKPSPRVEETATSMPSVSAESHPTVAESAPVPVAKPEPVPVKVPDVSSKSVPKPLPSSSSSMQVAQRPPPAADMEDIPIVDEYSGIEEVFETSTSERLTRSSMISKEDELKGGILLLAILRFFSDLYVSKKGNHFTIETLDGPLCDAIIENGKIKFSKSSFEAIDPKIKKDIQNAFMELSR
ncbi:MAG: hypothetical protein ACTSWN_01090 [Promethearchaeota archaeon]